MGEFGHEGDGGCMSEGLTMRGRHWLIFDTIKSVHSIRRKLSESLNFPPLLTFTNEGLSKYGSLFSAVSAALPDNVKLVTLTSNYASYNDGQYLLRLSHLYEANEHPTLSLPVKVNLENIFAQSGMKVIEAHETTLTGNRDWQQYQHSKHKWKTKYANAETEEYFENVKKHSYEKQIPFSYPTVTLRPMDVRTFLIRMI